VLSTERLQVLFDQWVAFERTNGTAETLALCKERLQKWQDAENEKKKEEEAKRRKEEEAMKTLQKKRKLSASGTKEFLEKNNYSKSQKLDETSTPKENEKQQEFKKPQPIIKRESAQQSKPEQPTTVNLTKAGEEKQHVAIEEIKIEVKPELKQSAKLETKVETKVEKKPEEEKEESDGMDVDNGSVPEAKKKFDDKMTAFFNNVPFKATEEEIKEFLSSGGASVKEVRLVLDRNTKKSKGFGYADFENAEDRQKCIADCNGKKYPNSQGKVKVEISKPPTVAKPPVNPYLAHNQTGHGGRSMNFNRTPYINKNNNSRG
jgi:hypothetical protein